MLLCVDGGEAFDVAGMQEKLGIPSGQVRQAVSWLLERGCLVTASKRARKIFMPTERAHEAGRAGLPEMRIIDTLREHTAATLPEIAQKSGMEMSDVGSAFGKLRHAGVVDLNDERQAVLVSAEPPGYVTALTGLVKRAVALAAGAGSDATGGDAAAVGLVSDELNKDELALLEEVSKKRGTGSALFKLIERTDAHYQLTESGGAVQAELKRAGISGDEISALTKEHLRDGSWKGKRFRAYNINIPASRTLLGRTNAYAQYLRDVKDQLVALGFEEFDGPLVETEFWNCDALYMPQFHAARGTHDVYVLNSPTHASGLPGELVDSVAAVHSTGAGCGSRGWHYSFDKNFTKRLILRSQGTALSAKQLHDVKNPGRYFGVVRCFRNDQIDATHLSDFYQTEGIVVGESVNLRTLLGLLRTFAVEIAGATDVRFVPGYFPFTEPSVEVHVKHPQLGWFELGGSGVFRPEVTAPFGITVPVIAWGLGIDRMALIKLGLEDLRELFTTNLESVRLQVE